MNSVLSRLWRRYWLRVAATIILAYLFIAIYTWLVSRNPNVTSVPILTPIWLIPLNVFIFTLAALAVYLARGSIEVRAQLKPSLQIGAATTAGVALLLLILELLLGVFR
ncbi:MAG: hypothetical protein COU69_00290 [Candidatus Pacebacteria bacterium CG10_big_fil_rev_8_21_14_0_10_56_10]|nr:MAG: hypothetical protein COU69_00290 [Candidatus Pacebacteria bacterium CG10_big_fil_rev_8_21_14_0_10_56_10]